MARRYTNADIVFWIALTVLGLWILGKIFGFIHTPAIIEAVPYISAVFIAGTVWQQFKSLRYDVKAIKSDISALKSLDQRLYGLEHEHEIAMGRKKIKIH